MNTTGSSPRATIDRWVEAEASNNLHVVEDLIADDFMVVGPAGFILNRARWLARFDEGLHNNSFALTDLTIREHDDIAVGIGVQRQETDYRGGSNNGNFRITLILTRVEHVWTMLGYHLSPMMGPA